MSLLFNMELRRDRKHTGVYVAKRPCHYYGDQPRLQLVYGVTQAQYTGVYAVSSLQGPGAWGMSLLETSVIVTFRLVSGAIIVLPNCINSLLCFCANVM